MANSSKLQNIIHDSRLDSYLKLKIYLYILDVSKREGGCKNNIKELSRELEIEYTKATRTVNTLLSSGIVSLSSDGKLLQPMAPKCCRKGNIECCPKGNTDNRVKKATCCLKGNVFPEEKKNQKKKNSNTKLKRLRGGDSYKGGVGGEGRNGTPPPRIPSDSSTETEPETDDGITEPEKKEMFSRLLELYPESKIGPEAEAYRVFSSIPHLDREFPIMATQIEDLTSRPGKDWDEANGLYVPMLVVYLSTEYWERKYQNIRQKPDSTFSIEAIRRSLKSRSERVDLDDIAKDFGL